MNKIFTGLLTSLFFVTGAYAQRAALNRVNVPENADSVQTSVHSSYNKVSKIHRKLFGENFRKEWAATVTLPVIRISKIDGGLKAEQYGGGMETKSIRMISASGKEWVIRSVEKTPDKIVPENLRGTFALDWVDDEYTGQHPYSALIVPPLADAVQVPHAHPVIGVLAPDPELSQFGKAFAGRVVLLEEREPTGSSINTLKMLKDLQESYNNRLDGEEFLRARMLDLLIGDWDRHEDQWRWTVSKEGKERIYVAVPRDRDQVFHVNQGVFPSIAALPWIDPILGNFDGSIPEVKYSLFKTRFIQQYTDAQFTYDEWMKVVKEFVHAENDAVLAAAIDRLPKELYAIRHDELLSKLKKRRDCIELAMSEYYYFINRIVDIRATDKDEQVTISDGVKHSMRITIEKLGKGGKGGDTVMKMEYRPDITKEIRLYLSDGNDHVIINNAASPIKLRIVGANGEKRYDVQQAYRKINVYDKKDSISFTGASDRLIRHLSNDTSNTHFVATNPYNVWTPLANATLNKDDGFLLGLGFRYVGKDAFRNLPYSTIQDVMVYHSFETKAFSLNYAGQWMKVFGKTDFTLNALVDAPDNTMNFFGQGNETTLDKSGDYHKYYRTRFDYYQFDPAFRWHTGTKSTISVGPSLDFYHFDANGNSGRSIYQQGLLKSYDSTSFTKDKAHIGLVANYISNKKDNQLLPTKGYYIDIKLQGYAGLNSSSKSFAQLKPEFTYFQKIDTGARLVLSDRIGGGVSVGNPAFYQEFFLGGQGNLLGYLQNRFSGQQMAFNDFQARYKIANLGGYILPGQLGVTGFYDIGRVWVDGEHNDTWHYGTGGGVYFAPASLTVIQVIAGHSKEGWYPYIAFNFRL
ncbi:MAG: outer membrane protein assembly factor [Bacteroidota bacterium]|nr:outer membrane protein assembly factor [Bacteroidota bacterium]